MSYAAELSTHYAAVRRRLAPPPRRAVPPARVAPAPAPLPSWARFGVEVAHERRLAEQMHASIAHIQAAVCIDYGITSVELISHRRAQRLVRARHVAMWLCCRLTPASTPVIGRCFGGRDHTTVLHAVRRIDAAIAQDAGTAREVAALRTRILAEIGGGRA